jgi:membrane protein implicated in regulation of membrane protease activity
MPWWLWALLGVLALVGESISMAVFLLNVAIAAFLAAALSLMNISVAAQVGVFLVVSILLIGLARPRLIGALMGRVATRDLTNQGSMAGRVATVTQAVTADGGTIRVGVGEFWTARANAPASHIEVGSRVHVTHVDGLTAYVDPAPALVEASFAPDVSPVTVTARREER